MHIRFDKVIIEGFQSIGEAKVELLDQGLVQVKGINNYEENSDSNGSGKSSIFESILFAIYGRTSSGIVNPCNRNSGTGCLIDLYFNVDGINYRIVRSVNHHLRKTSLQILRESEDISSRNKTDTQKIIYDVIGCQQNIFTSTIYLNQGLGSRLSALQPGGRKERLESLANISGKVESFKRKAQNLYRSISDDYDLIRLQSSKLDGSIQSGKASMRSIMNKIKNCNNESDKKIEELKSLIDKEEELINGYNLEMKYISKELETKKNEIRLLEIKVNNLESEKNRLSSLQVLNSGTCPLCHQNISDELSNKLRSDVEESLRKINDALNNAKDNLDKVTSLYNKMYEEKKTVRREISNCESRINNYKYSLSEFSDKQDLKALNELLNSSKESVKEAIESQRLAKDSMISVGRKKDVSESIVNYITKDFRMWLLDNVVEFLNLRLHYYSKIIFSNESDSIRIIDDKNKIDIYVGSSSYESLSGGEKRRVDLAITLAQRDLAINVAGISSNIVILDEVFDNLDDKGIQIATKLFTEECLNSDSMFIISHKSEVAIPSDYTLLVIKEVNQISHIERLE